LPEEGGKRKNVEVKIEIQSGIFKKFKILIKGKISYV